MVKGFLVIKKYLRNPAAVAYISIFARFLMKHGRLKNHNSFLLTVLFFSGLLLVFLPGCKDPLVQNANIHTKSDTLNLAKDTVAVVVSTRVPAPPVANGLSNAVLGSLSDRNFGITYGSFYAQCQLSSSSVFFGYSPVLDSAVLTIAYNGQYGLCNKPINIAVYELSDSLSSAVNYYTNSSARVKTPPIGQLNNFVPDFYDSVYITSLGVYQPPSLNVHLSNAFGNRLLLADSAILQNGSNFLNYFRGIYVTTTSSSTGNGMMYLNLASALSGVNLYYHYKLTDTSSTYTVGNFTAPFLGVAVNHFDNTYYGTPVAQALNTSSNTVQQKIYLEGGGGTVGKIVINLNSLDSMVGLRHSDSLPLKIGINKAELVFTQSPSDTQYAAPLSLNLLRIDDAGVGQPLEDASTTMYGGNLETDYVNGIAYNRYRFQINRYFQHLIQGVFNNNGLFIETNSPATNVERVVLANSPTNNYYKISLVVTYTKF
jgi:hypothetical protein